MVKRIRFSIDKDGEVRVDVEGAIGAECDALTAPFEDALGLVVSKERREAFYAETESTTQETTA